MQPIETPYCSSPCCDKSKRLAVIDRLDRADNSRLSTQSPIMITPCKSVYDRRLKENPLVIHYYPAFFQYENNGHTIKFDYIKSQSKDKIPSLRLGGATTNLHEYKLAQFHFHWGYNNELGSEHFINDESYSGEIHLVHWNSSLYLNADVAMTETDGLVVLAIFIKASKNCAEGDNFLDSKLSSYINNAINPNKKFETDAINIEDILPKNYSDYYTYDGSLTTPPYTENVKWIVLKNPICASFSLMNELRSFKTSGGTHGDGLLKSNFRNIMPLNERVVYRSFYNLME